MRPTLFTLEFFGREFPYYSYGALYSLAFVLGILVALKNARREGISTQQIVSLSLAILVSGVLGARVLQLLAADNSGLSPGGGGFAFYGGYLAAVAVSIAYCRSRGIRFLAMADTISPGIALGLVSGRIGCLLAGCCWGRPAERPLPDWLPSLFDFEWPRALSILFTHPDALAPRGIQLVPTQWALAASALLTFAILQFVVLPRKRWTGQVFAWFLLLYPVQRAFWEFFRDDPRGLYLGETLSTSQGIGIPLLGLGLWLMLRNRTESPQAGSG